MQLRLLGLVLCVLQVDFLGVGAAHCAGGHFADLRDAAAGVAGFFAALFDFFRGLVVHVCVGLELEEEVAAVDDEEEDRGS